MKNIIFNTTLFLAILSSPQLEAHVFSALNSDGQTIYYNVVNGAAQVTYCGYSYSDVSNEYTGAVSIPSSVTYNGNTYSVTSIGNEAFYGCVSLSSVTIPNTVTSIGSSAFKSCSGLESIIIPNSVSSIGNWAFEDCGSLTSVTIPHSITSIGNSVFFGCTSLTSIAIPTSVTSIGSRAFCNCSSFTSITIPNSVTTIGEYAFSGCSGITSITIPSSVNSINNGAFSGCSNLISVHIKRVTPPSIGYTHVFYNTPSDKHLYVPCGSRVSYASWVVGNFSYSNVYEEMAFSVSFAVSNSQIGSASATCGNSASEAVLTAEACHGYRFSQWGDGNTNNPRNITLTQDTLFAVEFTIDQFTVHLSCNNIHGSVLGSGVFYYRDTTTISASANYGYHFACWSDGNTDNPRNLSITDNINLQAIFAPNQYCISLYCDTVMGDVSGNGLYDYGSMRTISVTPYYGYHFTQWNDGDTCNPRIIRLERDTAFFALFEPNRYTLALTVNNSNCGHVTGEGSFLYLDTATLTAISNYGYHFARWSDNNTDNPRTLIVTDNVTLQAIFDPDTFHVTLSYDITRGSVTGGGDHPYGSSLVLAATALYGYHFAQWSDGDTCNPRTLTVERDTALTALFERNTYILTLTVNNSTRGSVNGGGTYLYLDTATISAIPNNGYHFARWSDNSTANHRSLIMTDNTILQAIFCPDTFNVDLLCDTTQGGVGGGGNYPYGSSITITATANYGFHFSQWNDGITDNPRQVTVQNDTLFTAYFTRNEYSLSLSCNDAAIGTVSGAGSYLYHDTAVISATAAEHHHLVCWSSNGFVSSDNPCHIIMTCDYNILATFSIDTHHVAVTSGDLARGMVEGSGDFAYGTPATVFATAYSGYHFVRWSNGATYNPYTFAVLEDTELMAIFEEDGGESIAEATQDISVYPNPTSGEVHIDCAGVLSVEVFNMQGICIMKSNLNIIDLTAYPAGIYLLRIATEQGTTAVHLVKR